MLAAVPKREISAMVAVIGPYCVGLVSFSQWGSELRNS